MKCSVCRKKKEKLYCQACATRPISHLQIAPLTRKIDSLKQILENDVGKTLHLYFDSQEKREKQLELKQLNNRLLQMKDMRSAQEEKIIKLALKKQQKLANAKKLIDLKSIFKQEIAKKKEYVKVNQEKIQKISLKLGKMRTKQLKYYNSILEMNTIYPNWTIYKELRFEKEGDFCPIQEEDISDACVDSDSEEKFEKITFAKNFASLNHIYGGIMSFSLNNLGKIVYYFTKIYRVLPPLVMILQKDQVEIGNFLQNKEFFNVRNIAVRKNFTNSEKFLILLFMNMKFLIKKFKLEVDDQEFMNWKTLMVKFLTNQNAPSKNVKSIGKTNISHSFKIAKVKYTTETPKVPRNPTYKIEDSVVVLLKSPVNLTVKTKTSDNSPNLSSLSIPSEMPGKVDDDSFEILDNLEEIENLEEVEWILKKTLMLLS